MADVQAQQMACEELVSLIKSPPIAYFCAEFAVDEHLPIYAGGLGVLAGDLLYQASDEGRSYVGVGLFYRKGYLHQEISKDANMLAEERVDPVAGKLFLLTKESQPVTVTVPIHDKQTRVCCFVRHVGSCVLLLLDTQVEGNDAHDMSITDRLYFGDREHRFEQEMILGIGGYRMLDAIGIVPRFYHLNEGHSALLFYELARARLKKDTTLAFANVISNIGNVVFTNHTLVPAGNDVFSRDLAISSLSSYSFEFPIDPNELVGHGIIEDTSLFSPTMLALRLATVPQAVSKLHAKKALDVWSHHPMIPVTNGVRQAYWQSTEIARADKKDTDALWRAHTARKKILCDYVASTTQTAWNEKDFIIGWSRRIARYKRPLTILEDESRLREIVRNAQTTVRIVISGKPHVNDDVGLDNLAHILQMVGAFGGSIVYLQNYSLELARLMLSGIDVFINTPVRGFEACGTSGMKAGLNGVLQCTTLDGWTDEVDWKEKGWVLDSDRTASDLYTKLSREILPLFTTRNEKDVPEAWVERMRQTILLTEGQYTAARMLRELDDTVYSHVREDL